MNGRVIARESSISMAKQITQFAGGALNGPMPTGEELDPRALLRVFWRRKILIVGTVALVTLLAVLYAMTTTPVYRAETLVRIQPGTQVVIDLPEIGGPFEADDSTIESEVELLESRAFAARMIDELNLMADPEFNPALRSDDTLPFGLSLSSLRQLFDGAIAGIGQQGAAYDTQDITRELVLEDGIVLDMAADVDSDATVEINDTDRLRAIQAFRKRLAVGQVSRSYILEIAFTSEDAAKAALIANATAESYIRAQVERKRRASDQAITWLQVRVNEMRDRVIEAEGHIADYQGEHGLSVDGRIDPLQQQASQLNAQLVQAQGARAEAEVRYGRVKNLLDGAGGAVAAADVLSSPLLAALREQESELNRKSSELKTVFGQRHPQMINLRAEQGSVRTKMAEEVRRIATDLANEVEVMRARQAQLEDSLAEMQSEMRVQDISSVELNDLQREAAGARNIYENFLQRLKEVTEAQDLQRADALVLSAATVPVDPSWPNKKLIVLVAFGVGAMLAVVLAFVVERWDGGHGFRAADEILSDLGVPALSLVPDLGRNELKKGGPEDYVLHRPQSAYAEALQRIRTTLYLSDRNRTTRTVLITSSVPVEGKSSISASLARQSARAGLRTLLIDADLRRPRLHSVFGLDNREGFTDVLLGERRLDDILHIDEASGLRFLPAGLATVSPPDLFRRQSAETFLEEIRSAYDLIVIDSAPVGAVSDSLVLARQVDKVVYVVRWQTTPRNVVVSGLRQLLDAGGDLAGVVLSRVNVKKHAQYGYSDSGTYAGKYGQYYVN